MHPTGIQSCYSSFFQNEEIFVQLDELDVDTVQVPLTVFWHYTRFSGSLSSLDITNGNRSHNKPLELI